MAGKDDEPRFLFVDDNPFVRTTLPILLGGIGIRLEIATNAQSAVENIEAGGLARVFTDSLRGKWRIVADAAINAQIPVTLYSADRDALAEAERSDGVTILDKNATSADELVAAFSPPSTQD